MQILYQFISLIFIFSLFFMKNSEKKIELMIVVMLCMTTFPNPVPMIGSELHKALPVVFCFSEINNYKKYYYQIKQYHIRPLIYWIIIGNVFFLFTSPHAHANLKSIAVYFISNLFQTYLVLPLIFCICLKKIDLRRIYKTVYYCLIFITFWGILNMLLHRGVFIDLMYSGREVVSYMSDLGMKYSNTDRFRVQATFLNAFNYGFSNLIILLFNLYCYNIKLNITKKSQFLISLFCCLFGIYTCGCRTIIFCSIISIIIFILLAFEFRTKIKLALMLTIIGFIVMRFTSIGSSINENISSVFSDEQEVGSSSISMRESQWLTVLSLTKDHILLGRGDGYFYNDLNFSSGTSSEKSLQALEGVYLSYMLERGILGLLFYYVIWFGIVFYILKRYKNSHLSAAFGVAVVIAYLSFAHATGELLSLFPTLVFLGIALYLINNI